MKIFKLLASIVLLISLVLPISHCSGPVDSTTGQQMPDIERYVISAKSDAQDWVWFLLFFLPLCVTVTFYRSNTSIKSEVISIVTAIPVSIYVVAHWLTGSLALGGGIAAFSALTIICISAWNIVHMHNQLHKRDKVLLS